MFIVWGTKRTERKSGWVADYCPICDDARACRLIEVRMVSHLYYIPLGRGELAAHLKQCKHCKNKFGTNPERYSGISKDKRASVETLTDETHPELIEGMAKLLDLRERAAHGEVNDDDRRGLLYHPFTSIVYPAMQRTEGIHFDGQSWLWLLAMIVMPLLVFFVFDAIPAGWIDPDVAAGLAAGVMLVAAICLIVSIARDSKRFIRRRFSRFIIDRLVPLNPTIEELQDVIQNLKNDPDTAAIGKVFKPEKLHRQITFARENKAADL